MSRFFHKLRGFTLLELLVVMAIIGILAAIGIASFGGVQSKARDARRKSDLANFARALEMFYNDNGRYPIITDVNDMGTGIPAADLSGGLIWGHPWIVDDVIYMAEIPGDPKITNYRYQPLRITGTTVVSAHGSSGLDPNGYFLAAHLENEEDSSAARTPAPASLPGYYEHTPVLNPALDLTACKNLGCNYVLRSSNAPLPQIVAY